MEDLAGYQVGGFALAVARYAFPDIDLVHFYEENEAIRQVVAASPLPVLVDAGDGFGDVMEGGGRLPWLPPEEIYGYGFAMILYPTTVLFRVARDMARLRQIEAEYLSRCEAGQEAEQARIGPEARVASVIYSTG